MADDDGPRRLPPFGRQYLDNPTSAGLWVAVGPRSWDIANQKPFPVVVLPPGAQPADYEWPTTAGAALIFETGPLDDDLLHDLAETLMLAGAPSVVAIRESLFQSPECCRFFKAVPCGE